jgi:LacI family transcriptional regulator
MATIYDVAKHAGVSVATVSRALNGATTVDPDLARRVLASAKTLQYQPNGVARSLRRQRTALWMLLISDIENPFFTSVARGVEDVAQAAGFSLVLCNSDEDLAKERAYISGALQERAAGVLLAPASSATDVGPLLDRGVPVVTFDRLLSSADIDSVVTDSVTGARDATTHLLEQGWQRIACIGGPRQAATAQQRALGYQKALSAWGRQAPIVVDSDFRAEGGRSAMQQLLAAPDRPDGVFVANNLMALGVLSELAAAGLRPGHDLGVVAFDDPPWAALLDPPLSAVAQPAYEVGRAAAQLLRDRTADEHLGPPRHLTLPCQLWPRTSSVRNAPS